MEKDLKNIKEVIQEEKRIAKTAKGKLHNALKAEIHSLDLNYNMDDNKESMFYAKVQSNFDDKTDATWFNNLAIRTPKHSFIHHYGIDPQTLRKGKSRTRHFPKETKYSFKTHVYKKGMKSQNYITNAIEKSNVISYVMENLTKVRTQQVFIKSQQLLVRR